MHTPDTSRHLHSPFTSSHVFSRLFTSFYVFSRLLTSFDVFLQAVQISDVLCSLRCLPLRRSPGSALGHRWAIGVSEGSEQLCGATNLGSRIWRHPAMSCGHRATRRKKCRSLKNAATAPPGSKRYGQNRHMWNGLSDPQGPLNLNANNSERFRTLQGM